MLGEMKRQGGRRRGAPQLPQISFSPLLPVLSLPQVGRSGRVRGERSPFGSMCPLIVPMSLHLVRPHWIVAKKRPCSSAFHDGSWTRGGTIWSNGISCFAWTSWACERDGLRVLERGSREHGHGWRGGSERDGELRPGERVVRPKRAAVERFVGPVGVQRRADHERQDGHADEWFGDRRNGDLRAKRVGPGVGLFFKQQRDRILERLHERIRRRDRTAHERRSERSFERASVEWHCVRNDEREHERDDGAATEPLQARHCDRRRGFVGARSHAFGSRRHLVVQLGNAASECRE